VTSIRMRRIHRRPRGRSVAGAMRGSLINLFCLRSVSAGPEIRPPVRETPLRRTRRLAPLSQSRLSAFRSRSLVALGSRLSALPTAGG
jgi:hypothetical protein